MASSTININFAKGWKMKAKLSAQFAVGMMAHEAKKFCEKMIGADDHTLQDLADMGHPYATRNPQNPHDPPETVHTQSGRLLAGLKETAPKGNRDGVTASVVNEEEELDGWVQRGTRLMIARPYMDRVRNDHGAEIIAAGKAEMEKRMSEKGTKSA